MKKRVFFLLAALCLLFTSCGIRKALYYATSDSLSLTIENNAERKVKFTYIDHDSDPELPVTVEAGSSRVIEFPDVDGSHFTVRFVYDSVTYEDSIHLSHSDTYTFYIDSNSRLMVKVGNGRGRSPHRR
ncbi:MAG: hypothetical protein J5817_12065 [Treponema sp.]|nr:hypothetical protein [Treponema sp.]